MDPVEFYQSNLLKPQNFSVVIDKLPHTVYHCRQVPLPSMNINQIVMGTGEEINYKIPGSIGTYDALSLMFAVDEDCKNYLEIFDWMDDIRDNEWDYERHTSDASVILHTNKNNPNVEFIYKDIWPMSLTEITFNVNDEMPEMLCTAIFSYEKLLRNKNPL